jgi:hypothetical protein
VEDLKEAVEVLLKAMRVLLEAVRVNLQKRSEISNKDRESSSPMP